jgi:hypothetical protein
MDTGGSHFKPMAMRPSAASSPVVCCLCRRSLLRRCYGVLSRGGYYLSCGCVLYCTCCCCLPCCSGARRLWCTYGDSDAGDDDGTNYHAVLASSSGSNTNSFTGGTRHIGHRSTSDDDGDTDDKGVDSGDGDHHQHTNAHKHSRAAAAAAVGSALPSICQALQATYCCVLLLLVGAVAFSMLRHGLFIGASEKETSPWLVALVNLLDAYVASLSHVHKLDRTVRCLRLGNKHATNAYVCYSMCPRYQRWAVSTEPLPQLPPLLPHAANTSVLIDAYHQHMWAMHQRLVL